MTEAIRCAFEHPVKSAERGTHRLHASFPALESSLTQRQSCSTAKHFAALDKLAKS
jgi:hypothetical protein